MNFLLELGLTLSVFVSSFLVLSIEKDWWGGALSASRGEQVSNFKEFMSNGQDLYRKNRVYTFGNTIRLSIIGCTISFFCLIIILELIQSLMTCIVVLQHRVDELSVKLNNLLSSAKKDPIHHFSNKDLAYQSQILVSNL